MNAKVKKSNKAINIMLIIALLIIGVSANVTLVSADGETPTPDSQNTTIEITEVEFDGVPEGQSATFSSNEDGSITIVFNFVEPQEDDRFTWVVYQGDSEEAFVTDSVAVDENNSATVTLDLPTGEFEIEFDNELHNTPEMDSSKTEYKFAISRSGQPTSETPTNASATESPVASPTPAPSSTPTTPATTIPSDQPSVTPVITPTNTPVITPSDTPTDKPRTTSTPNVTPTGGTTNEETPTSGETPASAPKTGMAMESAGFIFDLKAGVMTVSKNLSPIDVFYVGPDANGQLIPAVGTIGLYQHDITGSFFAHLDSVDSNGNGGLDVGSYFLSKEIGDIITYNGQQMIVTEVIPNVQPENWNSIADGKISFTTCQPGSFNKETREYDERFIVILESIQ